MDRRLPSEGAAAPGVLILNPRMLNEQPATVRLFVFHHECGHHHVGDSELKADCWAVERGVRDGWLDQRGLKEVCDSFEDAPETSSHPSGRRRCRNLDQCFATALAALPPRTPHRHAASSQPPGLGGGPKAGQGADAARHGLAALCRQQALRRAQRARASDAIGKLLEKETARRRLQLIAAAATAYGPDLPIATNPFRRHRRACDSPPASVTFLHYQQDWPAGVHSAVGRSRGRCALWRRCKHVQFWRWSREFQENRCRVAPLRRGRARGMPSRGVLRTAEARRPGRGAAGPLGRRSASIRQSAGPRRGPSFASPARSAMLTAPATRPGRPS